MAGDGSGRLLAIGTDISFFKTHFVKSWLAKQAD